MYKLWCVPPQRPALGWGTDDCEEERYLWQVFRWGTLLGVDGRGWLGSLIVPIDKKTGEGCMCRALQVKPFTSNTHVLIM